MFLLIQVGSNLAFKIHIPFINKVSWIFFFFCIRQPQAEGDFYSVKSFQILWIVSGV